MPRSLSNCTISIHSPSLLPHSSIISLIARSKQLHTTQNHPDDQLLQHVHELLSELDAAGIVALPETEQDEAGAEGSEGWEDVNDDDDDYDVEMG